MVGLIKKGKEQGALAKLRAQKKIVEDITSGRLRVAEKQEALVICIDGSASMHDAVTRGRRRPRGMRHERSYYGRNDEDDFDDLEWTAAVEAAKTLIARSAASDIGLVVFDHTVLGSLPVGTRQAEHGALLDELIPVAGTCFGTALHRALELLEPKAAYAVRRIVLMSDGKDGIHGGADFYERAVELCRLRKVIVDTVGFGSDPDEDALRQLAEDTGGVYRHARDAKALIREFARLEAGARGLLGSGS